MGEHLFKTSVRVVVLVGCLSVGGLPRVWAQTQTTGVHATLDVKATKMRSKSAGYQLKKTISPGFDVSSKGFNTQIDGHWQFDMVDYTRNRVTEKDSILPSGLLKLRAFGHQNEPGIDASIEAKQVKSTLPVGAAASDTANTYTDTTYRLSPFIEHELDSETRITARLDRSLTQSNAIDAAQKPRPDIQKSDDMLKLSRQPTSLGYALQWHHHQEKSKDKKSVKTAPILNERLAQATALYTLTPELGMGLSFGKGNVRIGNESESQKLLGMQMNWRPTERTVLNTEIQKRYFGKAWTLNASHTMRGVVFSLNSDRGVSTNGKLVDQGFDKATFYDVGAQIRQSTSGKMTLIGRRDTTTIEAGLVRTSPLTDINGKSISSSPTTGGLTTASPPTASSTKTYFFDAQLAHKLTPHSTVTMGLRWDQGATTVETTTSVPVSSATRNTVFSKGFTWRAGINNRLTPDTTATFGLKRQITRSPSITTSDDAEMFVGLGHRF